MRAPPAPAACKNARKLLALRRNAKGSTAGGVVSKSARPSSPSMLSSTLLVRLPAKLSSSPSILPCPRSRAQVSLIFGDRFRCELVRAAILNPIERTTSRVVHCAARRHTACWCGAAIRRRWKGGLPAVQARCRLLAHGLNHRRHGRCRPRVLRVLPLRRLGLPCRSSMVRRRCGPARRRSRQAAEGVTAACGLRPAGARLDLVHAEFMLRRRASPHSGHRSSRARGQLSPPIFAIPKRRRPIGHETAHSRRESSCTVSTIHCIPVLGRRRSTPPGCLRLL